MVVYVLNIDKSVYQRCRAFSCAPTRKTAADWQMSSERSDAEEMHTARAELTGRTPAEWVLLLQTTLCKPRNEAFLLSASVSVTATDVHCVRNAPGLVRNLWPQ